MISWLLLGMEEPLFECITQLALILSNGLEKRNGLGQYGEAD